MGVCMGQLPQYVAKFDGQSGYISTALKRTTTSFSFTFWAYPILAPSSPACPMFIGEYNQNWWGICYGSSGFQTYTPTTSAISAPINSWHFVAVTNDGTTITLYVNNQKTTLGGNLQNANNVFYIGYVSGGNPYFKGSIANVQFYNSSLSANEIQAMYLGGIGGAPFVLQNLMGWWPLNGNANDYSGNNNNGVPTNVVFTSQYGK